METRLITFGGSSIAITYSGERPASIVDFLFRHTPTGGHTPLHVTYRLTPDNHSERLLLYRNDRLIYEGQSETALAESLLGDTCHHLAGQSRGGLLFHAAGLAWQGKGLLLPGGIGAGKTTLTAWLARQGLDYLTDELVFLPPGSSHMQTFTRPLNLKKASRVVLQNQIDFEGQAEHILSSAHADLISPTLLMKSTTSLNEPPLSLIIFPRYRPDSSFVLRSLSKAQAGLASMECLVNARNLPDHGFAEITRLVKIIPAYRMIYSHFDQIETMENINQDAIQNMAPNHQTKRTAQDLSNIAQQMEELVARYKLD